MRKRKDYQRVGQSSHKYVGQWIILHIRQNREQVSRLGITVTRQYGKAHRRNRFKRLVREAFRLSYAELPMGLDIHVKPRSSSSPAKIENIRQELVHLLAKACPKISS